MVVSENGITAYVFKRGNGYYYFKFQHPRRKGYTFKSTKQKAPARARLVVRRYLQEISEGREPSANRRTLEEVGQAYLLYLRRRRRQSWADNQRMYLEAHILPFFGADTLADTIVIEEIDEYLDHRVQNCGIRATTANKELSCLRKLFRFARQRGYVRHNPALSVERLENDSIPHTRALAPAEMTKLVECAGPTVRDWIVVCYLLGLRTAECNHLKWTDFDFDRRVVRIINDPAGKHHTKTSSEREIPLVPLLARQLRRMPRRLDTSYIFTGRDGGPRRDVKGGFHNAVKRASLQPKREAGESDQAWAQRYERDKVTPHTLRHSWATVLAENGIDKYDLKRWGGWKEDGTVNRYIDLARTRRREIVAAPIDDVEFFATANREAWRKA